MKYERVELEARRIRGIKARTGNLDPQMSDIIGGLWQRFFAEQIPFTMPGRVTETLTALYSDYETDETGSYDVTVGCEVGATDDTASGALVEKRIPAGTYARFALQGDQREQVAALWQEIWVMDLKRTYTGDFEEYFSTPQGEPDKLHIYIAIES